MSLLKIAATSFADEMNKIAEELDMPINGMRVDEAMRVLEGSFLDTMFKEAATRAVKEWRRANAAGDTGTADAIAKGYGQLGLKPRHVKDISEGGGEAGVDLLMGRVSNPNTGAVNESGLTARKLYKPDSTVTRGEFTGPLLAQKQRMTDTARAMSPEAKAIVPDMYGHKALHEGDPSKLRHVSYHEYVPNASDIRGQNVGTEDKPVWHNPGNRTAKDIASIENHVVRPLQEKGMNMGDVLRQAGGQTANYGNMVSTPNGPKVLDFIPEMKGEVKPHHQSFVRYAPEAREMQFNQKGALPYLRKEVFRPQMKVEPASPYYQQVAQQMLGKDPNVPTQVSAPKPEASTAPSAQAPVTAVDTKQVRKPIQPSSRHQVPAGALAAYSDPFPSSRAKTAPSVAGPTQVAVRPKAAPPSLRPSVITQAVGRLGAPHR